MMNEFDWLSLRIPYGQPIKFIEDSLRKPMRWLVLVNSLRVIKTSASLFQLLALWGNKNVPPSMKVKKMEIFQHKKGLKECIWSSLNAPGNGSHFGPFLQLENIPFANPGP